MIPLKCLFGKHVYTKMLERFQPSNAPELKTVVCVKCMQITLVPQSFPEKKGKEETT
jgi:hypothetical protein